MSTIPFSKATYSVNLFPFHHFIDINICVSLSKRPKSAGMTWDFRRHGNPGNGFVLPILKGKK
jgi:hypothetical protein